MIEFNQCYLFSFGMGAALHMVFQDRWLNWISTACSYFVRESRAILAVYGPTTEFNQRSFRLVWDYMGITCLFQERWLNSISAPCSHFVRDSNGHTGNFQSHDWIQLLLHSTCVRDSMDTRLIAISSQVIKMNQRCMFSFIRNSMSTTCRLQSRDWIQSGLLVLIRYEIIYYWH